MSDVPPVPADDAGPPPAPRPPRRVTVAWTAGVSAAILLAAGLAFFVGRQSGDSADNSTTTTTTAQPAVTAGPGWSRSEAETVGALALALEQSSATRALSTATVLGVERCAIPLAEATAQLDTVIAQRRAIIADVEALDTSGGLRVAAETLSEALEFTLLAEESRKRWVEWLATEWSGTYTGDCWPPGQAPTDANLEAAQFAAANAATARSQFLSLFNPLATAASLRAWDVTEF